MLKNVYHKPFSSMASKPIDICWIKTGFLAILKKSCIVWYYRQFSTNIKKKNHKINTSFVSFRPLGANIFFSFWYPRKAVASTINSFFEGHIRGKWTDGHYYTLSLNDVFLSFSCMAVWYGSFFKEIKKATRIKIKYEDYPNLHMAQILRG